MIRRVFCGPREPLDAFRSNLGLSRLFPSSGGDFAESNREFPELRIADVASWRQVNDDS